MATLLSDGALAMHPYGIIIFQVAAAALFIALRFPRILLAGQITVEEFGGDPGVFRRTTFKALATGSNLALGAIGILNGRALVGDVLEFAARLGGFSVVFFCAIVVFVILHVMEWFGLGELGRVPDEEVLTFRRRHFMLGIGVPLPVGVAMIFLSALIR